MSASDMDCPFKDEHTIPNNGAFADGRRSTTIPRMSMGALPTVDDEGNQTLTFRCMLGHEWSYLATSDEVVTAA